MNPELRGWRPNIITKLLSIQNCVADGILGGYISPIEISGCWFPHTVGGGHDYLHRDSGWSSFRCATPQVELAEKFATPKTVSIREHSSKIMLRDSHQLDKPKSQRGSNLVPQNLLIKETAVVLFNFNKMEQLKGPSANERKAFKAPSNFNSWMCLAMSADAHGSTVVNPLQTAPQPYREASEQIKNAG